VIAVYDIDRLEEALKRVNCCLEKLPINLTTKSARRFGKAMANEQMQGSSKIISN
jgi:hypothetical protein